MKRRKRRTKSLPVDEGEIKPAMKEEATTEDISQEQSTSEPCINQNIEQQTGGKDHISKLSLEMLCKIFDFLPLRYVMMMDWMSSKLREAATLHLRVRKKIDLSEHTLYGRTSGKMTDSMLLKLLSRCRDLENIYGFHPPFVMKRRKRGRDYLTIQGIIEALMLCKNLKGIELSDPEILEAVTNFFPRIQILGTFKNRNGSFPVVESNVLTLPDNPLITSLHLSGISIPCLNRLVHLRHLQMRWVKMDNSHPFKDFAAPNLVTFVMAHCAGPSNALMYVPLLANLATARKLSRMELICVPFLGRFLLS